MLEGRWKGGQWRRVTAIEKESEGENRRKKCDLHPGRNYFKRRSICSAVGEHKPFLLLLELFHSEWETYFTSFCKVWGHKRHVSSLTLSCNDGEPETFNASKRKRGREREGEWREEFMARMTQMSALPHEQLRSLEDDERTNRLSPQSNFPLLSHCSSFNFRLQKWR